MTQPKKIPVRTRDGGKTFSNFEPTPKDLAYQKAYVCAACYDNGELMAVGGTPSCGIYFGYYQLEKCPICKLPQDWAQANAEEEQKTADFKKWFDENQVDGCVVMLNEQGTGYLQREPKKTTNQAATENQGRQENESL